MIIKERIEREISFSREEVETIRKFRDFLQNFSDEEWEVLEEEFKAEKYTEPAENDMTRLFDLVDDFYIFAKIN
jgi:DNA-binding transcriptional regulator/RsmH inhibitor MraZ